MGEAHWPLPLAVPVSHGNSRAVPTRRAIFSSHAARSAPLATSSASAHAERKNAHGGVRSPCAFRCAGSDEQRGDLGFCQIHDASAAIKPVPRPAKRRRVRRPSNLQHQLHQKARCTCSVHTLRIKLYSTTCEHVTSGRDRKYQSVCDLLGAASLHSGSSTAWLE